MIFSNIPSIKTPTLSQKARHKGWGAHFLIFTYVLNLYLRCGNPTNQVFLLRFAFRANGECVQ